MYTPSDSMTLYAQGACAHAGNYPDVHAHYVVPHCPVLQLVRTVYNIGVQHDCRAARPVCMHSVVWYLCLQIKQTSCRNLPSCPVCRFYSVPCSPSVHTAVQGALQSNLLANVARLQLSCNLNPLSLPQSIHVRCAS